MATEAEIIAKAKRAVLSFGISQSEIPAFVARSTAAKRTPSASARREMTIQAEAARKKEFDKLGDLLEQVKNSDDWKYFEKEWPVNFQWGLGREGIELQTGINLNDKYRLVRSEKALEIIRNEGGARIENLFRARLQIAAAQ